MSNDLLAELKKLQHHRSKSTPFANHVEFHTWADKVLPLLAFDLKLQSQFRNMVSATKSARIFEIKQQEVENINSAIGILNQAIFFLESPPLNQEKPEANTTPNILEMPTRVTVKWLYEHVPFTLVLGGLALLSSAFSGGIAFSETQLYALIKSTISATVSASTTAKKIKKQMNSDPNISSPQR